MLKRGIQSLLILVGLVAGSIVCNGQARNLLQNPNADAGPEFGARSVTPKSKQR